MTSYGDPEDNEREYNANTPILCLYLQKVSQQVRWLFLGPGSERSGLLLKLTIHNENGTESQN